MAYAQMGATGINKSTTRRHSVVQSDNLIFSFAGFVSVQ
jgi:hypothetical protein